MKLYFFRHGQAEDAQAPAFDDSARNLTQEGIERTQNAAQALVKLGIKPIRVYSSPRARAKQTAEILAKALKLNVNVREEINYGFNLHLINPLINDLKPEDDIIIVGHEPDLSVTISTLIGGGEVVMKKGGMARIDVISRSPLRGGLAWVLTPHIFDAIAGKL